MDVSSRRPNRRTADQGRVRLRSGGGNRTEIRRRV